MNIDKSLIRDFPDKLLPKNIFSIKNVVGGYNNENILINDSILIKKFQQQDEKNDPVYKRFIRELTCLKTYDDNKHVPTLIDFYENDKNQYISRNWIKGSPLNENTLKNNIKRLVNSLLSIHSIKNQSKADFDYFDIIRRYVVEYKLILPDLQEKNEQFSILPQIATLEDVSKSILESFGNILTNRSSRIHGDLVFSNIILDNSSNLTFIDWEYSTLAHPMIDIAYLISQNNVNKELASKIISTYSELSLNIENTFLLGKLIDSMNIMSGLWYAIHAGRSYYRYTITNPQNSEYKRYIDLALKNFQKVNSPNLII